MSSMNFIHLTEDKLDINAISDRVTDESCGAISLFVGTTRDNFDDKKVGRRTMLFLSIFLNYQKNDDFSKKKLDF